MNPEGLSPRDRLFLGGFSLVILAISVECFLTGTPLVGVIFFGAGAMYAGAAAGFSRWSSAAWALRATLIVMALAAYFNRTTFLPIDWIGWSVIAVAVALGQYAAHRLALGWITDSRGERQKVESRNRGHAVYTPMSRSQRIIDESLRKSDRRTRLLWTSPALAGFLWATFHYGASNIVFAVAAGVAALALLCFWVPAAAIELLYLTGYQDMRGHKVLDPEPQRRGIEDVVSQKVHTDPLSETELATEDEAIDLLTTKR